MLIVKNKIIYLFFVITGSIINFIFYLKFFANTNYDPWVYIVISVIFTGITAILYYRGFKQHKKIIVWCAALISIFSIFCSTAGQFADSQSKINNQIGINENINQQHTNLDYAWKELERLNREWESLETEKRATIKTAADRYEWKNTTAKIETRQAEIKTEKQQYENMIFKKSENSQIIEQYASDIFDQISTSVKQKIVIMLIFEILISIIIELVAPLALYLMTLNESKQPASKKKITPAKTKTIEDYVKEYADSRFDGIKNGVLNGRPVVIAKTRMSPKVYQTITKIAMNKKLIILNGKIPKAADFVDKNQFVKAMLAKGE